MRTTSIAATISMLALCLTVVACAGSPTTAQTAADKGSDMQASNQYLARWVAGIDSMQD